MSQNDRRVLVPTTRDGTIELLAEPDRVVLLIEHGDRAQRVTVAPSVAKNLGRRLSGVADQAWRLRDQAAVR